MHNAVLESGSRLREELERLGRERRLECEWRSVEGSAAYVVPQQARCADLCIVGQDGPSDANAPDYSFSEQAELVRIDAASEGSVADALQEKATSLGADLLVAGAFGHPRLWEKLLGGVTRDLLARMRLPILMSH